MPKVSSLINAVLVACVALRADTANIGLVSFDNFIAGVPGISGVNVFDISNLTGDPSSAGFALPPDFPVLTSLTFTLSSLTVLTTDGPQTITLGDIGPGSFASPASLQFPDTTQFLSATFFATLDQTSLLLSDGSTLTVARQVEAALKPSSGGSLEAGADFVLITTSPEPHNFALMLTASALLLIWTMGKTRRNTRMKE